MVVAAAATAAVQLILTAFSYAAVLREVLVAVEVVTELGMEVEANVAVLA